LSACRVALLAQLLTFENPAGAEEFSVGGIFDRFQLTFEDGFRTEVAGPFFYSQEADSNQVWALPPFYSHERNPAVESQEDDWLYPLMTRVRYGRESRWQFCELLSTSSGLEPDAELPRRFEFFPFYFQQRAADPNLNYTALLPFYGRLKNHLFRDEIHCILFPAYVETRKRDVVTDNYFFPFVDVHHGDGMKGWQVWPFAGREHKAITMATNGYGETTLVPGHDRSFYLWPFYLREDAGAGTEDPEQFRAAIPFFALTRSPQRDSTSVLWPIFTSIDDRGRKYREWQGPWPFVIFTRGEGKHTSRVWPIFSESHNQTKETDSYGWPIYVHTRTHDDPMDLQSFRVLYYLYHRLSLRNTETGKERIRLDMWPFFTWHRDFNGNERLQILAPLEPGVPDNPAIERNWSPLWSVWREEKNARTGAFSQSLLWNLCRLDSTPTHKKIALLFGLYQQDLRADDRSIRLFYIPVAGPHAR
jgi:hypothetical protein